MISPPMRSASITASSVLPLAVGPTTAMRGGSAGREAGVEVAGRIMETGRSRAPQAAPAR